MENKSLYALILAGGSGTRFWPLSRNEKPKQLLKLFGNETLLEKAVSRLDGVVPRENILILTNAAQEKGVRAALPDFPEDNILAEPEKRDTAPAVALAVGWVAARDPAAAMLVLPADQLINDQAKFQAQISDAAEAARITEGVVTIGIKPTWACPSYGYIERGKRSQISGLESIDSPVYEVIRFREKPDTELAEQFLEQGNFSWNAGMFIWTVPTVVRELSHHCPELADFISNLRKASDFQATFKSQFPTLPKVSIDYALMEKCQKVYNVEATFDWDDVGSWISVGKYLNNDANQNSANCELTEIDSQSNIVFNDTDARIALLGVDDLIVVNTGDAILIASRNEADRIKKLIGKLPEDLL